MDDFIRRFDALPDEEKEKIYTRIGQATAQMPPGSLSVDYLVESVRVATECMRELTECMREFEGVQHVKK